MLTSITSAMTPFPDKLIPRHWGLEVQSVNLGGHNSTHENMRVAWDFHGSDLSHSGPGSQGGGEHLASCGVRREHRGCPEPSGIQRGDFYIRTRTRASQRLVLAQHVNGGPGTSTLMGCVSPTSQSLCALGRRQVRTVRAGTPRLLHPLAG